MRLIDATTLKAEFTGNFRDEYPTAMIKAIIDTAPTVGGWTSVKDRLPEEHECANEDGEWLESDYVLTFVSNSLPYYPRFYIGQTVDGVWDLEGSDFLEDSDHVTHWMPLPKPPEAPHDAP